MTVAGWADFVPFTGGDEIGISHRALPALEILSPLAPGRPDAAGPSSIVIGALTMELWQAAKARSVKQFADL